MSLELTAVDIPKTPKRVFTIKKITVKGDWEQTDILYHSHDREGAERKTNFTCKEKPNPDFPKALSRLVPNVQEICGLDRNVWGHSWISEVRFKEIEGGTMVNLTIHGEVHDRICKVTTPAIFPQDKFLTNLDWAIAEAEEFIGGRRAQLEIPGVSDEQ